MLKDILRLLNCIDIIFGEDSLNDTKCVPFVSEYSDCSEANYCSGCNRCKCNESGQWQCEEVFSCPLNEEEPSEQDTIVTALDNLQQFIDLKKQKKPRIYAPPAPKPEDELIVPENSPLEESFDAWFSRQKRSLKEDSEEKSTENTTIKFFHTVDDINEDTLKTSNKTGTIEAHKISVNQVPKISRRTVLSDNINRSDLSSLHIEYNQPQDYDHHISENKIDAVSHSSNKLDDHEIKKLIGNFSQSTKDKELSKLIVNELKPGNEIIGDKNVTPTSNITFTPENDTLTAMAFIAGNLLSKLWDMEKDTGEDSIETEVLKHEKINDLLELFKEPLSIRQEIFLKNALEKLSESLNKNKSANVSICETIEISDLSLSNNATSDKVKMGAVKYNKTKCEEEKQKSRMNEKENQYNITVGVVSKLNHVLGLIKKFENVHKNLKNVKYESSLGQLNATGVTDIEENPSYEVFGTLLDKITKLLIPNKNKSKRVTKKLKNSLLFASKSNANNIYENKFNINFGKINITTKDKLVLDYLNHIENNPNCLFRNNMQGNNDKLDLNVEGSILYNLSEFFKIKSFVDLMKLTQPNSAIEKRTQSTTEIPIKTSSYSYILRNSVVKEIGQSISTKDKLKSHLKAIVDDLEQLQKEHGIANKNMNVMEALPCIYKILNAGEVFNEQVSRKLNITRNTVIDKLKSLIDLLKLEFETNVSSRRNNAIYQDIPKSAKVWERMIRNIHSFQNTTRRSFDKLAKPKMYDELKDVMDKVEHMGNTYKNFALYSVVPPQKRKMLLKTLETETRQQSSALASIRNAINTVEKLPLDKRDDINDFIDNVGKNLRLSAKVLENVNKLKQNRNEKSEVEVLFTKTNKEVVKVSKTSNSSREIVVNNNKIKLSRDQILNQLMMNRVQRYLTSKEISGADLSGDINYNIGKRILFLIQAGNLNVAKELFRIFLVNKQKEEKRQHMKGSTTRMAVNPTRSRPPLLLPRNIPSMRFTKRQSNMDVQTRDNHYKQLLQVM